MRGGFNERTHQACMGGRFEMLRLWWVESSKGGGSDGRRLCWAEALKGGGFYWRR